MANKNAMLEQTKNLEELDYDELECLLQAEFDEQMSDLDFLNKQKEQVGNPDALGNIILNTVWEQFTNQIAIQAGEDFIKENNGLKLDISNDAHIQTTENFANGKIASHNTKINYQKRYDDWQANIAKDENGDVITHTTRTGKEETTLGKGARDPYDVDRPKGSAERHTDMDHTVSAAEIIRDSAAATHMTKEEQIAFANSDANLNEMDSSWNRSKGDKSMSEWLDNPNAKGKKPNEIFDISAEDEEKLRQKDDEAREEYERQKNEAEQRSIEVGKRSQKAETLRISKKAARAVVMNLLADLVKKIIQKLVLWLKSDEKSLKTFLNSVKDAVVSFVINFKNNVVNVVDSAVTVIATSILGPVVNTIKRAWMFIKQGWSSLKQSINYIRDSKNKNKPIGILMMEVGKIVTAGLTAGGAIVLGEAIEVGLSRIPIFAIEIPLFGSLANIIGIFMGAVISGIIGALAINLINSIIAKKQRTEIISDKIKKGNEILNTQEVLKNVVNCKVEKTKSDVASSVAERHKAAGKVMKELVGHIKENTERDFSDIDNSKDFAEIDQRLKRLSNEGGC